MSPPRRPRAEETISVGPSVELGERLALSGVVAPARPSRRVLPDHGTVRIGRDTRTVRLPSKTVLSHASMRSFMSAGPCPSKTRVAATGRSLSGQELRRTSAFLCLWGRSSRSAMPFSRSFGIGGKRTPLRSRRRPR